MPLCDLNIWIFALSCGPPLQTDLFIGILRPVRLYLAIAQKMNHKDTKAQICLFMQPINHHIKIESFVALCLCGFKFESQCPHRTASSLIFLAKVNSLACCFVVLQTPDHLRQLCHQDLVHLGERHLSHHVRHLYIRHDDLG